MFKFSQILPSALGTISVLKARADRGVFITVEELDRLDHVVSFYDTVMQFRKDGADSVKVDFHLDGSINITEIE